MIASQKERKIMLKFFSMQRREKKLQNIHSHTHTHKSRNTRVEVCSGRWRKTKKKLYTNDKQNEKREKSGQFTLHSGTGIRIDEIYFTKMRERAQQTKQRIKNVKKYKRNTTTAIQTEQAKHTHEMQIQNEMMLKQKNKQANTTSEYGVSVVFKYFGAFSDNKNKMGYRIGCVLCKWSTYDAYNQTCKWRQICNASVKYSL